MSMFRVVSFLTDRWSVGRNSNPKGLGSAILSSSTMVVIANVATTLDVRERTAIQHIMGG